MARGDQLGRQWRIIQTLLAARWGKSVAEIAEDLECHPRTVYRDLEALQVAGFPLYTDRKDGKNLWSLMETVKQQVPLPLNLTELMALYFSRDMMKPLENTVFSDSLDSLFDKIKSMLPAETIRYLEQVAQNVAVGRTPYKPYGRYRDYIEIINTALIEKCYIEMDYYAMSRRKVTHRKVAPYKIWFFDGTFYLIGYCCLRKEVRVFVIDRIKKIDKTDEVFQIPESFDFDAFMQYRFGIFHGELTTVKVRFSAAAAGYIQEKIWHDTQTIEEKEDGSIVLTMQVAGTEEIKHWIMSWGAGAEVLAPAALRDEICREAETLLKICSR